MFTSDHASTSLPALCVPYLQASPTWLNVKGWKKTMLRSEHFSFSASWINISCLFFSPTFSNPEQLSIEQRGNMNSQIELKSSNGLHNYVTIIFPWEITSPELVVYLETRENNTFMTQKNTSAKPCCSLFCICSYLFTHTHMYFFLVCG